MNPDPFSDSVDAGTQTEYSVPKRRKSIDKLESRKQILKRTNVLYQQTCDAAKSEGIELHRFFGILLHRYGVECHSSILYNSENRNYLIDQLPEKFRCNLRIFAQELSIILRIINSTEFVKVEVFKMFCIETYIFYTELFLGKRNPSDSQISWT